MNTRTDITCRPATLAEILPLREAVIIRGTGRPAEFPGDHEPDTLHYGAFLGTEPIGCATFMLTQWYGEPAYQLRGMATRSGERGSGVGRALLASAEAHIRAQTAVRQLWCSARVAAIPFYLKQGWSVVSDEFDVPNVGPHRKMCKRVSDE